MADIFEKIFELSEEDNVVYYGGGYDGTAKPGEDLKNANERPENIYNKRLPYPLFVKRTDEYNTVYSWPIMLDEPFPMNWNSLKYTKSAKPKNNKLYLTFDHYQWVSVMGKGKSEVLGGFGGINSDEEDYNKYPVWHKFEEEEYHDQSYARLYDLTNPKPDMGKEDIPLKSIEAFGGKLEIGSLQYWTKDTPKKTLLFWLNRFARSALSMDLQLPKYFQERGMELGMQSTGAMGGGTTHANCIYQWMETVIINTEDQPIEVNYILTFTVRFSKWTRGFFDLEVTDMKRTNRFRRNTGSSSSSVLGKRDDPGIKKIFAKLKF